MNIREARKVMADLLGQPERLAARKQRQEEAAAQRRRKEAARQFLARTAQGVNLGGVKIDREVWEMTAGIDTETIVRRVPEENNK